jgi:hypothetical protein
MRECLPCSYFTSVNGIMPWHLAGLHWTELRVLLFLAVTVNVVNRLQNP